jgi:hypothetical protein
MGFAPLAGRLGHISENAGFIGMCWSSLPVAGLGGQKKTVKEKAALASF